MQTRAAQDFDITTGSWYVDYVDASNFFDVFRADAGNNHTNWQNTGYDHFLDLAADASTQTDRLAYLEKVNTILIEDMPLIPLFQPMNNNLVHASVVGFQPGLTGMLRYQNITLKND